MLLCEMMLTLGSEITMTIQLRRYEVEAGELERLVDWFPTIAAVRDKYGFKIEFAYADTDNSEFIWAVSYPGDIDAFESALATYNESPERADAFDGYSSPVTQTHLSYVARAL